MSKVADAVSDFVGDVGDFIGDVSNRCMERSIRTYI
jgi:hypothetical protein